MGTEPSNYCIDDFGDLADVLSANSSKEQDLSEKLQEYLGPEVVISLKTRIALDYYGEGDYGEVILQGQGDGVVTHKVRLEFPFTISRFWESVGEIELALEELKEEEVEEGYDTLSISVYDNGGKTADRYTVLFIFGGSVFPQWEVRTASERPDLPNEVWMSLNDGSGDVPVEYTAMGRKLSWDSLPKPLRKVIGDYISFE